MTEKEIQIRLAENMKKYRKAMKYSQEVLAEKAELTVDTIRSIETMRAFVSEKSLAAIATALNVDVYKLFLPVPASFEVDAAIKESVLAAARQGYSDFLDTVKEIGNFSV